MAADEAKLFGCPHCGFRVSPQDEVCSRCGNRFPTNTMFECPFCGELVPRGSKSCPTCFVDFGEFQQKAALHATDESIDNLLMEIIKLEASEVKTQDKRLSCPRCSWLLDGTEDSCPKCGMAFTADATYQCPICGAFVPSEAESCSECGTAFTEEEGRRAEAHEEVETAMSDLMAAIEHRGRVPEPADERPSQQPPTEQPAPEPEQAPTVPEHLPTTAPEPVQETRTEDTARTTQPEEPAIGTKIEPEQEPEKASEAPKPAPKKVKTRKLKAKPAGPKA